MKTSVSQPPKIDKKIYLIGIGLAIGITLMIVIGLSVKNYLLGTTPTFVSTTTNNSIDNSSLATSRQARQVEEKYLQAARQLIGQVDESLISESLDHALAAAWAWHEYAVATNEQSAYRRSAEILTTASQLMANGERVNYFNCLLMKDIINDKTVSESVREQARHLCLQAPRNYYIDSTLSQLQEQVAIGLSSDDGYSLFMHTPGFLINEREGEFFAQLESAAMSGEFVPAAEIDLDREMADLYLPRQLITALDWTAMSREVIDRQKPSEAKIDDTRDLDRFYLTQQTYAWVKMANHPVISGQTQCLLYHNLKDYFAHYGDDLSSTTQTLTLNQYEGPTSGILCRLVAFCHVPTSLEKEVLLAEAESLPDEETYKMLISAGLLCQ